MPPMQPQPPKRGKSYKKIYLKILGILAIVWGGLMSLTGLIGIFSSCFGDESSRQICASFGQFISSYGYIFFIFRFFSGIILIFGGSKIFKYKKIGFLLAAFSVLLFNYRISSLYSFETLISVALIVVGYLFCVSIRQENQGSK